jgi:hypothetical protein
VSKQAILERERRWAPYAAGAAFASIALFVASVFVGSSIGSTASTRGSQLTSILGHENALRISIGLGGLAIMLFAPPLYYMFQAVRARLERIQPIIGILCIVGPVLLAAAIIVGNFGLPSVASQYADAKRQEPSKTVAQLTKDLEARPPDISKVNVYTDANVIEVETDRGDFYTAEYPQDQEGKLIGSSDQGTSSVDDSIASNSIVGKADVDNTITTDGARGDAIAEDLYTNSSAVKGAAYLQLPAILCILFGLITTALNGYRTGLITSSIRTLGIAFAVLAVLPIPIPIPASLLLALWFGFLGLIFIDRAPGGRLPAWAAAEAVPPPAPGERSRGSGRDDAIEGSGREADDGNGAAPTAGPTQKRKRKRRR